MNGFDAHLLVGEGGQGLPVFAQPLDERVLGKARVAGPLPPPSPTTLVSRGNPARTGTPTSTEPTPVALGTKPAPTTGPTTTASAATTTAAPGTPPTTSTTLNAGPGPTSTTRA